MGLIEQIQKDIQGITSNTNDFGVPLTFEAPTSPVTIVTVAGTVKKHHLTFDEFGAPIRGKANVLNATCSVSALTLNAATYPYTITDADGVVKAYFKGHKVTWADVSGVPQTYIIDQWYPDDQTGMIVLILGEYGTN